MSSLLNKLALPSENQIKWHDKDISMMIHLLPFAYSFFGYTTHHVPARKINPKLLDAEQWVQAAISMGAKRIVFVAKHEQGFCMWQTQTSSYGVKECPWRNGKGDIVADLSASCRKHNIDLGIYLSPQDKYLGAKVGGICASLEAQKKYNEIYRAQLTELLSRYGEIVEIWFDGSLVVDVKDIVDKYAPNAIIFQSPLASIRWVGNEKGYAPYPAWNGINLKDGKSGIATAALSDPDGEMWLPMEVDFPLRNHFWWWVPRTEFRIRSVEELMEIYYRSVGHGAVMLMNNSPDRNGQIPEKDMIRTKEFGEEIVRRFGHPLAQRSGEGDFIELKLDQTTKIDHIITMEDIKYGERVREYILEGLVNKEWIELASGTAIGHKKVDFFPAREVDAVRFRAIKVVAVPKLRYLSIYNVGKVPTFDRTQIKVWNPYIAGEWSDLPENEPKTLEFNLTSQLHDATQYQLEILLEDGKNIADYLEILDITLLNEKVPVPQFLTPTNIIGQYAINVTGYASKWQLKLTLKKLQPIKCVGKLFIRKL
jgi:alpha-L-fucosidase